MDSLYIGDMMDLSNLRLISAELDTTLAKELSSTDSKSSRLGIFKSIMDKIDNYVILVNTDLKVVFLNKKCKELLFKTIGKEIHTGDDWYKEVFNLDSPPSWDPLTRAINTRKVVMKTIESPYNNTKFCTINIPIIYNGVSGVVGIGVEDFNDS